MFIQVTTRAGDTWINVDNIVYFTPEDGGSGTEIVMSRESLFTTVLSQESPFLVLGRIRAEENQRARDYTR